MKRKAMSVVMCLLVCVCFVAAQTAEEVLENVRQKYDDLRDAELKFSQRVKFEMARVEQRVNGTLYLKKENKYRVELEEQTIVTNGETVWSFSLPTNQVLIDNFKPDERTLTPERILTGAPEDFSATVLQREKVGQIETISVKLVPRDDQSFITSMKLWVDPKEWFIRKVELIDQNGKTTEYEVKEIKINPGLQDSRFTFQIPEGVEVVDLR
ncbi:MAG: LolA family protein [Bacteroidota bacterium]